MPGFISAAFYKLNGVLCFPPSITKFYFFTIIRNSYTNVFDLNNYILKYFSEAIQER